MSSYNHVSSKERKDILERYGNRCLKCGRRKFLEIHHITLCVHGGKNNYFNLVPLCRDCHRFAPDDYFHFLEYIASRYSPHMEMMRSICYTTSKLFHTMSENEYLAFKSMNFDEYFRTRIEPIFLALKKLAVGYDEDEFDERDIAPSKEEEVKEGV